MKLYRDFETQEQLDLEYRPELSMDDPSAFQAILDWRRSQSAQARRELKLLDNVGYGPTLVERMDIYPVGEAPSPIVLFIHGGYWFNTALTKELYGWVAKGFAAHGLSTAILDYGVCPQVTIDEIVRQCRAAVAWLHRNAASFGGDPSRIYAIGNSAGGHLAAMLATTRWETDYGLPGNTVRGACPISGLFDLLPFPYTWLQPKLQLTEQQIRRNSPILKVPRNGVPLLLTWGADESAEFHRQSQAFSEAWRAAGNPAKIHIQPGRNHFTAISDLGAPQSEFSGVVAEHIRQCFGAARFG